MPADLPQSRLDVQKRGRQPAMHLLRVPPAIHLIGSLGDENRRVAAILNNLAMLLGEKGDYAAAEPLYRESLAINRKLRGDENPYVANNLNNLASLLQDKGDYAAAEPLFREALAIRRTLLGDEHWSTLSSASNLGGLLHAIGRPEETIALLTPLEAAQRRTFTGGNAVRLGRFLTHLGRAREYWRLPSSPGQPD